MRGFFFVTTGPVAGRCKYPLGLAEPLREPLAPLAERTSNAFLYGSGATREDTAASDIDLMGCPMTSGTRT